MNITLINLKRKSRKEVISSRKYTLAEIKFLWEEEQILVNSNRQLFIEFLAISRAIFTNQIYIWYPIHIQCISTSRDRRKKVGQTRGREIENTVVAALLILRMQSFGSVVI